MPCEHIVEKRKRSLLKYFIVNRMRFLSMKTIAKITKKDIYRLLTHLRLYPSILILQFINSKMQCLILSLSAVREKRNEDIRKQIWIRARFTSRDIDEVGKSYYAR